MPIDQVIGKFNTTPFLFVGSGMTRRYLGLPDWKGLLEHFAKKIKDDPYSYRVYESKAKSVPCEMGIMPKIAELIQRDFDEKWFLNKRIRTVDHAVCQKILENGLSPFKAEIAEYIKSIGEIPALYKKEVEAIYSISEKSIAGVITTNYDSFLEDHFKGYKKYVGQSQLIFSAIQGVAEIYKIHGSTEAPESIIINEKDYKEFNAKSAYLAAKLMTIFMEYPIVFMGYSISDSNIQNIMRAIVNCLDEVQLQRLRDRFVFIEYEPEKVGYEISEYSIMFDKKELPMTKITLSDYLPLYQAIGKKRAKIPVRLLRKFKQDLYSYVVTNTPTSTLRVASIEDERIGDEELVLAIGKADQIAIHGLSGIEGDEWYRNVILDDLGYNADELLEHAFPRLSKQNSNCLPIFKYLKESEQEHEACRKFAEAINYDSIISRTLKRNRGRMGYHSVQEIWSAESSKIEKASRMIAQLYEEEIDVNQLEAILKELFQNDNKLLEKLTPAEKSGIRRLIRIYDYEKWGKVKELSD